MKFSNEVIERSVKEFLKSDECEGCVISNKDDFVKLYETFWKILVNNQSKENSTTQPEESDTNCVYLIMYHDVDMDRDDTHALGIFDSFEKTIEYLSDNLDDRGVDWKTIEPNFKENKWFSDYPCVVVDLYNSGMGYFISIDKVEMNKSPFIKGEDKFESIM